MRAHTIATLCNELAVPGYIQVLKGPKRLRAAIHTNTLKGRQQRVHKRTNHQASTGTYVTLLTRRVICHIGEATLWAHSSRQAEGVHIGAHLHWASGVNTTEAAVKYLVQ